MTYEVFDFFVEVTFMPNINNSRKGLELLMRLKM